MVLGMELIANPVRGKSSTAQPHPQPPSLDPSQLFVIRKGVATKQARLCSVRIECQATKKHKTGAQHNAIPAPALPLHSSCPGPRAPASLGLLPQAKQGRLASAIPAGCSSPDSDLRLGLTGTSTVPGTDQHHSCMALALALALALELALALASTVAQALELELELTLAPVTSSPAAASGPPLSTGHFLLFLQCLIYCHLKALGWMSFTWATNSRTSICLVSFESPTRIPREGTAGGHLLSPAPDARAAHSSGDALC